MRHPLRASLLTAAAAVASGLVTPPARASDGSLDISELYQLVERAGTPSAPVGLAWQPALLPTAIQSSPRDVTDAIWVGLGQNSSWTNAANWSTNLIPDGLGAAARFSGLSGGPVASLRSASVSLSILDMSDPFYSAVVGGTINLNTLATVNADGNSFDLPSTIFTFPGISGATRPGNNIGGVGSFATAITGTLGLNKTGESHIQIDSPQFYTGTTSILEGGKIISTVGDSAFGNAANSIELNNGSIQIASFNWSSSRTINIGPNGGSIFWVGANRTFTYTGNITGSGSFQLNGLFGTTGNATISTAQSFTGTLNVGGGTVVLASDGAFASAPVVRNTGTLVLNNNASGTSVNRLSDSGQLVLRNSALTVRTSGTPYSEVVGSTVLDGGSSFITLIPNASTQLDLGTLTRNNGGGAVFRGMNLGQAPGGGASNVYLANGTSLLVNGVIPFAWGNGSFETFTGPESADNVLVGYGPNGVTPIQSYNSDFSGSTLTTNVRLSSNTAVGGLVNVNALVLSPGAEAEVPFGQPAVNVTGGTIHVESGAVLSGWAGYNDIGSGSLNVFPGNQITSNLDFGSREAVIMTPSALVLKGVISGSGGLTKIGGRTAQFEGASTYTGTTTLNGLNRFVGNVLPNTNGPFGNSATPIVLYGGIISPTNPLDGGAQGSGMAHLGSANATSTLFSRDIEARGSAVLLRNFGTGSIVWGGTINLASAETILTFSDAIMSAHNVVTGSITGAGRVENHSSSYTDLMGANSFTGGFTLNGVVGIGNDLALSTGSVAVASTTSATIQALGGARNLANPFVVYAGIGGNAGTFTVSGANPIEFSGGVNGRGGDYPIHVINSATTTISGPLTGGGFIKSGTGTLVISGNNTFAGAMTVGNGTNAGGMVIARSSNFAGSIAGVSLVNNGQNALGLDGANASTGSLTIPEETLFLAGDGISSLGSLRNLSGNNVWRGVVRPIPTYSGISLLNQRATIGVDAGTLTIDATVLVSDPGVADDGTVLFLADSIGLRKSGPGMLVVGSSVINSTVGSNSFNWNGGIVATGSLEIAQGTLQLKKDAGIGTIAGGTAVTDIGSLSIVGGPSSPAATLDLTNNALVIDYTGATPYASMKQYVLAGRAGGSWTGNGITSSLITPGSGRGIGIAEATGIGSTLFAANPIDTTSVLLRYTYLGDANLDGQVDITDLARLATAWQTAGEWVNGDFDYSGFVDITDLAALATNWQAGVAGPALLSFGAAMASLNFHATPIPEPLQLCLPLLGAALVMRRSRRDANL